jgi:hypothetical protein
MEKNGFQKSEKIAIADETGMWLALATAKHSDV